MRSLATVLAYLPVLFFSSFISVAYAGNENYRSPEKVEGTIPTTHQQARSLFDQGAVFIDVRNPRLYAKKHIPGAHHLDLKNGFGESSVSALAAKSDPIVIYSSGIKCSRSYRASAKAVSWGFTSVHYFRGGIIEWKEAGYPMEYGRQNLVK